MSTLSPFEFSFPDLARLFDSADECTRRKAILAVCSLAITQTKLQNHLVNSALQLGCVKKASASNLQSNLVSLANKYDDEYFTLTENTEVISSPSARLAFNNARILSALAFCLDADIKNLNNGIYEAIMSVEDKSEAIEVVHNTLNSSFILK